MLSSSFVQRLNFLWRQAIRPSQPVSTSYKCSVFKIPITEDFNSPYSKSVGLIMMVQIQPDHLMNCGSGPVCFAVYGTLSTHFNTTQITIQLCIQISQTCKLTILSTISFLLKNHQFLSIRS